MASIYYSPEAEKDLEGVFAYLREHSENAVMRLAESIDQRTAILAANPGIGRDRSDLIEGLRSSAIEKFVLFFRLKGTTLEIVRLLHGARDIDSIFHQLY